MKFILTESDIFEIRVKEICFGNETIEMVLGDHTIEFMPSYMGREPLTTLIDSLNEFELEDWDDFTITWADEPGCWKIELNHTSIWRFLIMMMILTLMQNGKE